MTQKIALYTSKFTSTTFRNFVNMSTHRSQRQHTFKFSKIELRKNETLGSGSYGAVCIAKCDDLECAAKLLYSVLFDMDDVKPTSPRPQGPRAVSPRVLEKPHRIPISRFKQECQFLSQIKHPNIVQYLGTYQDPDSHALVLLMELMDESLTNFLSRLTISLPYYLQVGISHDIALALAYLHSNNIIHRDLSSNNILLLQGYRAKVSDFGMSTLVTSPSGNSRTICPGTPAYMPPEALNEPPSWYSEMLDTFSFGVLLVQIMTQKFPNPSDRFTTMEVQDPRQPNSLTEAKFSVAEVTRRKEHIDMIDADHPLLHIAKGCLNDTEQNRPSAKHLCLNLETLKKSEKYLESCEDRLDIERVASKMRDIRQECQQQCHEHIEELEEKLENAEQEIQILSTRTSIINKLRRELSSKEEECNSLRLAIGNDIELQEKERALKEVIQQKEQQVERLQQQVDLQDQTVHDLQLVVRRHEQTIDDLRDQVARESERCSLLLQKLSREEQRKVLSQSASENGSKYDDDEDDADDYVSPVHFSGLKENLDASKLKRQIADLHTEVYSKDSIIQTLRRRLKQLEEEMDAKPTVHSDDSSVNVVLKRGPSAPSKIYGGSATSIGSKAYFRPSNCSEIYEFCADSGEWSQLLSCTSSSSTLIAIDNVLTIIGGPDPTQCLTLQLNKWKPVYPSMHVGRYNSTAIKCGGYLVVAGGIRGDGRCLSSVEVLKLSTRQWIICSSLPSPLHSASGVVINDTIYLLGGCTMSSGGPQCVVLRCSLKTLVSNANSAVWQRIADLPFPGATCVSAQDHLLAIGGLATRRAQNSIYSYNFVTKSWELLKQLKASRSDCLVSVISTNSCSKVVIVGGYTDRGLSDAVEICDIKL